MDIVYLEKVLKRHPEAFFELCDDDKLSFCKKSKKYGKKLLENEILWKNLLTKRYGNKILRIKPKKKTWLQFFIDIKITLSISNKRLIAALYYSAEKGRIDLIMFCLINISSPLPSSLLNDVMAVAASRGKKKTVEFLLKKGAGVEDGLNIGLARSCFYGRKDMVEFFISRGADNLVWAREEAQDGGYDDILRILL